MQATICLSPSELAVVYIYMLRFDDAEHACHRMLPAWLRASLGQIMILHETPVSVTHVILRGFFGECPQVPVS